MITDWHKGMKMLNEVPHGIFSVKVDGEKMSTFLFMLMKIEFIKMALLKNYQLWKFLK